MKDFANKKTKRIKQINKNPIFSSGRTNNRTISISTIIFILLISFGLASASVFHFKSNVSSIDIMEPKNSVVIDFPSSLTEDSVLIEFNENIDSLTCEYFVQIGAYGNIKYANEALIILDKEIQNITINEVFSSQMPGKKLHSVISGPYLNRSAANNAKEKITRKGFDPRLRTLCKTT